MTKCKKRKALLSALEWWEKRGKASHPMNCDDSEISASQPSSYELYTKPIEQPEFTPQSLKVVFPLKPK